jgi:hypothetical protein
VAVLLALVFAIGAIAAQFGIQDRLWLTFAIGALLLIAYTVKRHWLILAGGVAWLIEGGWELALRAALGAKYDEYNIRLDLLLILPAVICFSTAAGMALGAKSRGERTESDSDTWSPA